MATISTRGIVLRLQQKGKSEVQSGEEVKGQGSAETSKMQSSRKNKFKLLKRLTLNVAKELRPWLSGWARSSREHRIAKTYKAGLGKEFILSLHQGSYPTVPRMVPIQHRPTCARVADTSPFFLLITSSWSCNCTDGRGRRWERRSQHPDFVCWTLGR